MDSSQEPALRIQITNIDHTMVNPSELDNTLLPKAPVIRIFGTSSTGQKACLHVHQVYPYFMVEYLGKTDPDSVNRYIGTLVRSLNLALAVSYKRNPDSPNCRFVRAIVLVKGVHFYGFHSSYSLFLKIHIVDPAYFTRSIAIMQSGSVMDTRFRVFEGHLSFILQFLCDFNLYGCGWIELGKVWQRGGRDAIIDVLGGIQVKGGADDSIDLSMDGEIDLPKFEESPCFRQSRVTLEVDTLAAHILNRHQLSARNIHHKLTIPADPLPPDPLVLSVRELWEDERRRRAAAGLNPSPPMSVDPSEASRGCGGDWVSEERSWAEIRKRIAREKGKEKPTKEEEWEKWVMTVFESIEALWPSDLKTRKRSRTTEANGSRTRTGPTEPEESNPYQEASGSSQVSGSESRESLNGLAGEDEGDTSAEVDESMLISQELTSVFENEESEWSRKFGRGPEGDEGEGEWPEDGADLQAEEDGLRSVTATPTRRDASLGSLNSSTPNLATTMGSDSLLTYSTITNAKNAFQQIFTQLAGEQKDGIDRADEATPKTSGRVGLSNPASLPSAEVIRTEQRAFQQSLEAAKDDALAADSDHETDGIPRIGIFRDGTNLPNEPTAPDDNIFDDPDISIVEFPSSVSSHPPPAQIEIDDVRPRKRMKLTHDITTDSEIPSSPFISTQHLTFTPTATFTPRRGPASTPKPSLTSSSRQPHDKSRNRNNYNMYEYSVHPPTSTFLLSTLSDYGLRQKIYRAPHYSKRADVPARAKEYGGLRFHLRGGDGYGELEEWNSDSSVFELPSRHRGGTSSKGFYCTGVRGWEYVGGTPPARREVQEWLRMEGSRRKAKVKRYNMKKNLHSQIDGPTQLHPFGLKTSPPHAQAQETMRERQGITVFSLEVFAPSRGGLLPDPDEDQVALVFYAFQDSTDTISSQYRTGIVATKHANTDPRRMRDFQLDIVDDELDLLNRVVDIVLELDPDVIVGWEIQNASWGYLKARGNHYGFDVEEHLSRAPPLQSMHAQGSEQWGMRTTSTLHIVGRHALNVWRVMRVELSLGMYTFENTVFQVLRQRVPMYRAGTLTEWYNSEHPSHMATLLRYFSGRTSMVLQILDEAETITKTAEFARVFGVDFMDVLNRGSQFKVEAFMLRIAKPESFVLLSPSKADVGKQNAAECMPLIMEPQSAFYSSPVVVLDFQSLYPSIMIAYNYCYSTCLGRVTDFKGQNKFGVTELERPPGLLDTLQDYINVAPNGMMYVKPQVRKGLLGRMLTELLETRVMVKQAMKGAKDNKTLRRTLDARQLSLKFIANVTYGYTSASFSGRMPAVEVADSIVQSGRETLEKAISLIESTRKWDAKVVYGDTDSLFIYLPGRTKDQAFRIGHDIADTITKLNPPPVKLKFEKVYSGCVLLAKKRYVGFKHENPDDIEPVFDAKGIETVRRDGIPAQQKMTENTLKILFRTQDLSAVKEYCCQSWAKLLENRVSVQDFIFAREVKMGTYSEKVPPQPGVAVAAQRLLQDPMDEAAYGDRIPYVITRGEPHTRLVDRAVAPEVVLHSRSEFLDGHYYISRVLIPPLERIFNLVGADVRGWYDGMSRRIRAENGDPLLSTPKKPEVIESDVDAPEKPKIDEHFHSVQCMTCDALTPYGICDDCRTRPQATAASLLSRLHLAEDRLRSVHELCASCTAVSPLEPVRCESLDCQYFYERKKCETRVADSRSAVLQHLVDSEQTDSPLPSP